MKGYGNSEKKRILVVENESEISPVISKILNSATIEIDVASDGEIAERMLQEKDYLLCIIDLGTLMIKDKELYQYMNEKYPKLLNGAIFTEGGLSEGDSKAFMAQTSRLFLHKPFAPEWLKEMVSKALAQVGR